MAEPAKCVKKVVSPYDPTEKLSLVLAFAEENLPEGQYLIVAEALKKAHSTAKPPKPEPSVIKKIDIDLVVYCKDTNCMLHIKSIKYMIYPGPTPNDAILTYKTSYEGQETEFKEKYIQYPHCQNSSNDMLVLINNFIILSNSMDIRIKGQDLEVDFDYKNTLEKCQKAFQVNNEINNYDDDDADEYEWEITDYQKAVATTVKRIVLNYL